MPKKEEPEQSFVLAQEPVKEPEKTAVIEQSKNVTESLYTPHEHALRHGYVHGSTNKAGQFVPLSTEEFPYKREHLIADVVHGWSSSFKKDGTITKISDADYLAAITASNKPGNERHSPADRRTSEQLAMSKGI